MQIVYPLLLGISVLCAAEGTGARLAEPAHLREMLQQRQDPRSQDQAALLLVQDSSRDSESIVREGLRQTHSADIFLSLCGALRIARDVRFADELVAALSAGQPAIRQAAAETLSEVADAKLIGRLQELIEDAKVDWAVRLDLVRALSQSGRRPAVVVLLDQLTSEDERMRQAAVAALAEVTGQPYGTDISRWRGWWERHKDMTNDRWVEERLQFQISRSRRLEGELDRARAQVIQLHQQLYNRLPPGDRLAHVQTLADSEDAVVRSLAIGWCQELLATTDVVGQRSLADLLLRLSHDGNAAVQRSAILALGRIGESRVFDRLTLLLQKGSGPVRGAAARALAQQVRGSGDEAMARQRQVVPALQKALDDPELEVVVEAAESLGTLGVPEAGPVLSVLLKHPSRPVRQTAALALERVADATILDGILEGLEDPGVTIRFSLIGALGRAAGDGRALSENQRKRVQSRLEGVLLRDADPGVRGRAATVLGDCALPTVLPLLWGRVLANEDARVQEKSWSAIIEIIVRSASLDLLQLWDRQLVEAKQATRRLQLLTEAALRWQKRDDLKAALPAVQETLVQAQLEQGKWGLAFPVVREMLALPGNELEREKRLRWLLLVGEQALHEGKQPEALRVVREAQPFLGPKNKLSPDFEQLEKRAKP